MTRRLALAAAAAFALALPGWTAAAQAKEYFVGGPVHQHDMEIVANYLVGVEMAPMPPGMAMAGNDVIHLEADVHATADNPYGYGDGEWVGYLTIEYTLKKDGSDWQASGRLLPMTAKDGPHYAANVKMDGAGQYHVTYRLSPPGVNGFYHHTDQETGVPDWWPPFAVDFDFKYPQQ